MKNKVVMKCEGRREDGEEGAEIVEEESEERGKEAKKALP